MGKATKQPWKTGGCRSMVRAFTGAERGGGFHSTGQPRAVYPVIQTIVTKSTGGKRVFIKLLTWLVFVPL